MQGWKRTDYCTNFSPEDVGTDVTLMGWVQTRRDLGALIFVDLRDRTGIMQVVFDESLMETDFAQAERPAERVCHCGKRPDRKKGRRND